MSTSEEMWWPALLIILKSVTHARISYRTREITSVVYGRNAENAHTKMADYRALVSMGTLQLSSKRKTPFLNTSEHDTETLSCASRR